MADGTVGVILVGHGETASHILDAARAIVPAAVLEGILAVDAGQGETDRFLDTLCDTIDAVDQGRGVVVLVDLLGASPCQCAQRSGAKRDQITVSGLNLAMLLKLSGIDRSRATATEVADACAEAGQRAVKVAEPDCDVRQEGAAS